MALGLLVHRFNRLDTIPAYSAGVLKGLSECLLHTFEGTIRTWGIVVVKDKNTVCCWIIHLMWETANKLLNRTAVQWNIITKWLQKAGYRWSSQIGWWWGHSQEDTARWKRFLFSYFIVIITITLCPSVTSFLWDLKACYRLIKPSQHHCKVGIVIPILQMGEPMNRKMKWFAQGLTYESAPGKEL